MAKKSKSRLDQYRAILNEKGKTLEECDVLAFSFPNDSGPGVFHYELMLRSYPQYFIFDSSDRTAVVVIPKGVENQRSLIDLAVFCGGSKTTPNLR